MRSQERRVGREGRSRWSSDRCTIWYHVAWGSLFSGEGEPCCSVWMTVWSIFGGTMLHVAYCSVGPHYTVFGVLWENSISEDPIEAFRIPNRVFTILLSFGVESH